MLDISDFLLGALSYTLVVAMVLLVLIRKREPSAALGWGVTVVALPVVGAALFLFFGLNALPRRLRNKRAHRDDYAEPNCVDDVCEMPEVAEPVSSVARSVARVSAALGEPPSIGGNDVEILELGEEAFDEIFEAIRGARHHIHIEKFIFKIDKLGAPLLELLVAKARAGIEVRVIVDAVGTPRSSRLFTELRVAGGEGSVFMPMLPFGTRPLSWLKRFRPNLRNHRKIIVVDGEVGFVGGLNVGEEYLGGVLRTAQGNDWCDLHVRISGPAVSSIQKVFAEDWDFCTRERLEGQDYFPAVTDVMRGTSRVGILSGGPDRDVNPIRKAIMLAINDAEERVVIASPYVVPDAGLRDALKLAALCGVEVSIVTQSWPPEQITTYLCGSYFYRELLDAGVRIFEYLPGMIHAKAVVVDNVWAIVGSANFDNRSLHLNFEIMAVLETASDVAVVSERLDSVLEDSCEVTPEAYEARSWKRQLGESLARLLAPVL